MHTEVVAQLIAVQYMIIKNAIPTVDVILWISVLLFLQ